MLFEKRGADDISFNEPLLPAFNLMDFLVSAHVIIPTRKRKKRFHADVFFLIYFINDTPPILRKVEYKVASLKRQR